MRSLSRAWLMMLAVSALGVALTNCANPLGTGGGGSLPTPTPTGSPTPTPGPCGSPDTTNPNVVFVAMAYGIEPFTVAPYPAVAGYGVSDPALDVPAVSGLINVTMFGGTAPITTQNTVQFFNAETSATPRSAYGFKGASTFPIPYAFPSPAPSPTATTIANNAPWFTGFVPSSATTGTVCYSPEFKLTKGVYYFGDVGDYNQYKFRGVLIVGTPTPGP